MAGWWLQSCAALMVLVVQVAISIPMHARAQSVDDLGTLRKQVSQRHSQGRAIPLAERYVALAQSGDSDFR
jgi:hypothetical protein